MCMCGVIYVIVLYRFDVCCVVCGCMMLYCVGQCRVMS